MRNGQCPYPHCMMPLAPSGANPLIHCDGCGNTIILCPVCGIGNRIWAAFCRGCGAEISGRNRILAQDTLPFLENWEKSRGLFLSGEIETSASSDWKGKLAAVDGSLLVFSGVHAEMEYEQYASLFLVHPHLATAEAGGQLVADPLPLHPHLSGGNDLRLSGASVITDHHLFLGSRNDILYRIDLASISDSQAYRPDLYIKRFEVGCEEMALLSQKLLLLNKRLHGEVARFTVWDIDEGKPAGHVESQACFHSVADGRLIVASDEEVLIFSIDFDKKRFQSDVLTLSLGGAVPLARPLLIDGRLYLLASRPSNKKESILLKWVINGAEGIDKEPKHLHPGNYYGVRGVLSNYALLSFGGAFIYDSQLDRLQHHFSQEYGMHSHAGACAYKTLLALPFKNPFGSVSVAVVEGRAGQYVFITDPFAEILSEPVLWGHFLFLLGRRGNEEPLRLYGYDLMAGGKKRDDNKGENQKENDQKEY